MAARPPWIALLPALLSGHVLAAPGINLQPPATLVARQIYDLHTLVLWICVGIFVVVFAPMAWALWRHRRSVHAKAHQFHEHPTLEIAWSIAPFVILIFMAWPATNTVLAMKDTTNPDLTIKATGYQWKWEYEYLGEGVRFISTLATKPAQIANTEQKSDDYLLAVDKPLVVPTGKKVRMVVTANDVIHAWWVPAFGVKQDAIPGFIRDTWFTVDQPGTYRGQCAELCGVGHGFMPVVVVAMTPPDYAAWLDKQKKEALEAAASGSRTWALADLRDKGEKVFSANCAACHQASGAGIPGTFPALDGSPLVNGPKAGHLERVFHGKPGTAMQAFGAQLPDLDIAAVITYERNAWHNHTGDAVQPAEVAALRK